MLWLAGLMLSFAAGAAAPVTTPGFDCAKAKTRAEQVVCANPELSALDRRLSRIYTELQQTLPAAQRKALIADQRAWLAARDDCGPTASCAPQAILSRTACRGDQQCLHYHYRSRITQLLPQAPALAPDAVRDAATIVSALRLFDAMTPEDLSELAQDRRDAHLSDLSCDYFRRQPHEAERLFGAYFYSYRDASQPICLTLDIATTVPETAPLIEALQTAYGATGDNFGCQGSIVQGYGRAQRVARMLAVVESEPDPQASNEARAARTSGLSYTPSLAHWAQQGLWQKRQAERIKQLSATARTALQRYYRQQYGLKPARAAATAGYHLQRLIDVYTGRVGQTSTLLYATGCYDRTDLDAYLASGQLPQKTCPYGEYIDTSPPALLRILLHLALVNDYPQAMVERLIAAGAVVNPPPSEHLDTRPETPLMLAATRPEVIATLLKAGAEPNRQNNFGKTALMYAIAEKQIDSVRTLITAGADVNLATSPDPHNGCNQLKAGSRTPLMYAAWHATPAMVRLLLDHGADPAARDSNGETAADYLRLNHDLLPPQRDAMERTLAMPRPDDGSARAQSSRMAASGRT